MNPLELFKDVPYSRWAALAYKIGGQEVMDAVLRDDVTVEFVGQTLQIKEAVRPLFDKNGRRIPPRGLVAKVCDPNCEYYLVQPKFDYRARLAQFEDTGLISGISSTDFEARTKELLQMLGQNKQTKNLLKAVHLPLVIPQTEVVDLGLTTEEFVTAAGKSYCRQFPNRSFKNYRQGELAGQVATIDGSHYNQFMARIGVDPALGIWFPNPLQGWSVDAQREQMSSLPEGFVLSGPLDTAMGWVMYPDVLGRDYKTPGYDCSAVQWRSSEGSLGFGAVDACAGFDYRGGLAGAFDYYSGGLLFLG